MKIPLDYFLYIIKNFLSDIDLNDVIKVLKNHIDIPEEEFTELMGEMKDSTSLKDIFKFYCSSHPEITKFWKKKSKDLVKKYEMEQVNKEDEEEEEKIVVKKTKDNKNKEEKFIGKKMQRQEDTEDEESEEEKIVVKKAPVTNGKAPVTNGKAAEKTNLNNINQNLPTPVANKEKTPFKRIDNSLQEFLPATLRDNSYENFMYKTGDQYGREANEKLKVTKGRDFKKEKTKYKNKTGAGGSFISTEVRSIPLDVDSD